jgi:hypothetical protein
MVVNACNPSTGEWRWDNCLFEANLDHIANSSIVYIVRPFSKIQKQSKTKNQIKIYKESLAFEY